MAQADLGLHRAWWLALLVTIAAQSRACTSSKSNVGIETGGGESGSGGGLGTTAGSSGSGGTMTGSGASGARGGTTAGGSAGSSTGSGNTAAGASGEGGSASGGAPGTPGDGGAAPAGAGGDSGGAGAPGLACAGTLADCDEDPTTGCEVDLARSSEHCGGCDAACDGLCFPTPGAGAPGACSAFEIIASGQAQVPRNNGIALRDQEIYWASASSSMNAGSWRVQRRVSRTSSVETLLSSQPYLLSDVVVGAQRLYVLNDHEGQLYSMRFDGFDLRHEAANAGSVRSLGGRFYWHENHDGRIQLKSRSELDATDEMLLLDEVVPARGQVGEKSIAGFALGSADRIMLATNIDTTGSSVYEYRLGWLGEAPDFLGGKGRVRNPEFKQKLYPQVSSVYWIDCADADHPDEWLAWGQLNGVTQRPSAEGVSVLAYALYDTPGWAIVYYSYYDSDTGEWGLHFYDPARFTRVSVLTGVQAYSLTIDHTSLYFFDLATERLLRLDLPHVTLGH